MTAIMTNEIRIQSAKNFIRSIAATTVSKDYLYAFIARNGAWSGGTDSNGNEIPPTPIDKLNGEELTTRSNIIGAKRIQESDTTHVIPRNDWLTGTIYQAYSNNNASLFSTDFYVVTDDYNVYKCITSPGTASTVKPTGTSTSNLNTVDGYTWKFLYTVPAASLLNFLTTDWLPVPAVAPSGSAQESVEAAASYSAGQPIGGHGSSAVHELGGYYVMLHCKLNNSEGGVLPTNDDYRQVGVWLNPKLSGGSAATGTVYAAGSLNLNSGRVLYVENRTPIVRGPTQAEDIRIVIQF